MEPRTANCLIRLTSTEKAGIEAAAEAEALTLSAWIRQTLFRELARRAAAALEESSLAGVELERETPASIRVPMSESEFAAAQAIARRAGLPVGRWARLVLRKERPASQPTIAAQDLVVQLRRLGVNLNQLTKLANGGQMGAADVRFLLEVLAGVSGKLDEVEARVVEGGR
jgi:hypothetical protein